MLMRTFVKGASGSIGPILHAFGSIMLPRLRRLSSCFFGLALLIGLVSCALRPEPLSMKKIAATVKQDQKVLFAGQEPVKHPIDLYEAMARALKYNLDYRVQMLEKVVALSEIDLANAEMLPKLAANAGFTSRNSVEGSSGYSITNQSPSDSFSTSQDRDKITADLGVTWNILDFGVSYFQAKQATDRYLIAEENRRKLVHTQIQEVQFAFWRAVSAQSLQAEIQPILQNAKQALADARQVEHERLRPQLEIIRYQRALLDIVRQMEALQEELTQAKINLAKLLNIPLGSAFELKEPDEAQLAILPIRVKPEEMEQLALLNRPELRLELYQQRIGLAETRKALLKILPGLEFKTTTHYDSNSFAMNSVWETAGIQVAGNLMRLVSIPDELRAAQNQDILSYMRRLAMNMAILSQVHIAYRHYVDTRQKFVNAQQINEIDQRILNNVVLEASNEAQNRLEQIRAATQALMSRLQRNKAYAEAQNAVGMIFVSMGVDLLPVIKRNDDLQATAKAIHEAVEAWNDGISLPPPCMRSGAEILAEAKQAEEMEAHDEKQFETKPGAKDLNNTEEKNLKKSGEAELDELQKQVDELTKKAVMAPIQGKQEKKFAKKEAKQTKTDLNIDTKRSQDLPVVSDPAIQAGSEESIRSMIQDWADAWSRHEIQEFMRFYADSFLPAGNWSLQQWKEAYTLLFDTTKSVKTVLADLAVEVESADRARAFVLLKFDTKGNQTEKRKTLVLRHEAKKWRIVEEISGTAFSANAKDKVQEHGAGDKQDKASHTTPATESMTPATTSLPPTDQSEIWDMVHAWAEAWSSQELDAYLTFYSRRFKPSQGVSREEWKKRRTANFKWRRTMKIKVDAIKVQQAKKMQDPIRIEFTQHYYYDKFHITTPKSLSIIKEESEWKIIEEQVLTK
ncbi:MAG: TolC family protein [Magnetococcus sp. YQC-5]